MNKYILFGAGKNISNYIHIIRAMGDDVSLILDNSVKKQNTKIEGITIYSPFDFEYGGEQIIITCLAFDEIRILLEKLGISDREIRVNDYLKSKCNISKVSCKTYTKTEVSSSVVFDLYSYAKWGGAEKWNYTVASYLKNAVEKMDICLLKSEYVHLDDINFKIFSIPAINSFQTIIEKVDINKHIVFLNSFFGDSFYALLYLKLFEKRNIRIITVVHNDYVDLYKQCMMFDEFIDSYLCVSKKIANTMIKKCGVDKQKVNSIAQPIIINPITWDEKNQKREIRIGLASRLTKAQKRCDLVPKLIDLLEMSGLCYKLEIAGDGELFDYIKEYVDKKILNNTVVLYGKLSDVEMKDFWKRIDIYVNLSDFEGTSLAMLEAMSYMCVPVVTDVSGVSDYVENGISGFVHGVGDLNGICCSIYYLSQNRSVMEQMGIAARNSILKKCNKETICKTIMKLLLD